MAARLRTPNNIYDSDFGDHRGARSSGTSGHSRHTRKQRTISRLSKSCMGMKKVLKRAAGKKARREQREWLQTANLLELSAEPVQERSLDWRDYDKMWKDQQRAEEIEKAWEMLERGELPHYGVTLRTPNGQSTFPSMSEAIGHVLRLYPAAEVCEEDGFTTIDPHFRYNRSFRFTIAS